MQQRDLFSVLSKFDRGLSSLLHNDLHCLDVPERINYKLNVTAHSCLQEKAPMYLVDCCTPVSEVAGRGLLRSASRHHFIVPRYRLNTFGRRAYSVAGPTSWDSLPDHLRDPTLSSGSFIKLLKTELFASY